MGERTCTLRALDLVYRDRPFARHMYHAEVKNPLYFSGKNWDGISTSVNSANIVTVKEGRMGILSFDLSPVDLINVFEDVTVPSIMTEFIESLLPPPLPPPLWIRVLFCKRILS